MRSVLVALVLVLSAVPHLLAQTVTGGTVRGRIVDWATGLPLPEVTVTILQEQLSVVVRRSDEQGRFSFENLPQGRHILRVAAKGYALKDGIRSIAGSDYRVVDLLRDDLELRIELISPGTISGTVLDAKDAPLPNVGVFTLQKQFNTVGDPVLIPNGIARTNSRGEYALTGLPAGEYFIKVDGQPPVYYPGTRDPRDVVPVILGGTTTTAFGIDVRVPAADALMHVGGDVVFGDSPEVGIRVDRLYLMPVGSESGPDGRALSNEAVAGDGRFELSEVPPGLYDIAATIETNGRRYYGRTPLQVRAENVEGIRINLFPSVSLIGRVVVRSPVAASDISRVLLNLTPKGGRVPGLKYSAVTVAADASITSTIVVPEEYRIGIVNVPPGLYVESVRLDNLDVLERIVSITPTSSMLEVTLAGPAANVYGKVLADKGEPAVDSSMVVLVPLQPAGDDLSSSIKVTLSSLRGGDFNFPNVGPGRYRVLAFQNIMNGFPVYNRQFLEQFGSQGTVVSVDGSNPVVIANTLVIPVRQ